MKAANAHVSPSHDRPARLDDLVKLVDQFTRDQGYYTSARFDETSTRTTFIDPMFAALGWDMRDESRKGAYADVLREQSITGRINGEEVLLRPDYTFRVGGQPQLCVEAKRRSTSLDHPRLIFQVKNYAWNQNLSACILTNFARTRVFSTLAPPKLDEPWTGLIPELDLRAASYLDHARSLEEFLSFHGVCSGALARRAADVHKHGAIPIRRADKAFLADLERWRYLLAADLARHAGLSDRELTEASQLILDRLVFVRVCEDRQIQPEPLLRPLLSKTHVYNRLGMALRPFDTQYNGTLFKPHYVDDLTVSDVVLKDIIAALYPPKSPYRLDVLNVEILGTAYERFLGSVAARKRDSLDRALEELVLDAYGVTDLEMRNTVLELDVQRDVNPRDHHPTVELPPAA